MGWPATMSMTLVEPRTSPSADTAATPMQRLGTCRVPRLMVVSKPVRFDVAMRFLDLFIVVRLSDASCEGYRQWRGSAMVT